jgi:hypothetical protein
MKTNCFKSFGLLLAVGLMWSGLATAQSSALKDVVSDLQERLDKATEELAATRAEIEKAQRTR